MVKQELHPLDWNAPMMSEIFIRFMALSLFNCEVCSKNIVATKRACFVVQDSVRYCTSGKLSTLVKRIYSINQTFLMIDLISKRYPRTFRPNERHFTRCSRFWVLVHVYGCCPSCGSCATGTLVDYFIFEDYYFISH